MSETLIPHPTAAEVAAATKALAKGDGKLWMELLRRIDAPLELVDLLALALKSAGELEQAIAVGNQARQEKETLELEQMGLRLVDKPNLETATAIAKRAQEIPNELARASNAIEKGRVAAGELASLQRYFGELFGGETQLLRELDYGLPQEVAQRLDELGVSSRQKWHEIRRAPRVSPRPKIVAFPNTLVSKRQR